MAVYCNLQYTIITIHVSRLFLDVAKDTGWQIVAAGLVPTWTLWVHDAKIVSRIHQCRSCLKSVGRRSP